MITTMNFNPVLSFPMHYELWYHLAKATAFSKYSNCSKSCSWPSQRKPEGKKIHKGIKPTANDLKYPKFSSLSGQAPFELPL